MAIAATAAASGRRVALAFASGVLTGSISWALAAAFGMSALMLAHPWALQGVRYAGAGYLLWLGFRSARSALRRAPPPARPVSAAGLRLLYLKGLGLHLTNPKAILFWGSLFAVAVRPDAPPLALFEVVGVCALIGAAVFLGYAILFSTPWAMAAYARARRALEGTFALVFGVAGLALLTGGLSR